MYIEEISNVNFLLLIRHLFWLAIISATIMKIVDARCRTSLLMNNHQFSMFIKIFAISFLSNIMVDHIFINVQLVVFNLAITALITFVVSLLMVIANNSAVRYSQPQISIDSKTNNSEI